jgi:membrane protein
MQRPSQTDIRSARKAAAGPVAVETDAAAPRKPGWHAVIAALQGMIDRFGLEISGYIAFTAMLALLPFLMFLISLAGFLGETQIGQEFIATLSMFAPPQVMATLQPAIEHVIENRSSSVLTLGLILSLYSAGSGVSTLRLAVNLSYDVTETRPFWWRKLQDFILVVVGSVIIILASAAIILGPLIWRLLARFLPVAPEDQTLWHIGRYGFSIVMTLAGVMALHRFLPNVNLTIRQIFPGAVATTVLWILAASVLTLYFNRQDYTVTYGSLGGVIVTLLFFYISGIIFIFGGELNAALMRRRAARAANRRTSTSS